MLFFAVFFRISYLFGQKIVLIRVLQPTQKGNPGYPLQISHRLVHCIKKITITKSCV